MIANTLFAPVQSTTAFEETLERLSTAIKLGLLKPGARLPAERDLCEQLGIARSTLRQALTALVQSGHLVALRGRMGGTFVAQCPPAPEPRPESLLHWRDTCDTRLAVELGVAMLAAERAEPEHAERLAALVTAMERDVEDFSAYRQADVLFHIGLAETTGSPALVDGDDGLPGRDDGPVRAHRAPARGAGVGQRATRPARRLSAAG